MQEGKNLYIWPCFAFRLDSRVGIQSLVNLCATDWRVIDRKPFSNAIYLLDNSFDNCASMLDEKLSFEQTFWAGATMKFDYRTSWATIPVDCKLCFWRSKELWVSFSFWLDVNVTFVSMIEFENFFNSWILEAPSLKPLYSWEAECSIKLGCWIEHRN